MWKQVYEQLFNEFQDLAPTVAGLPLDLRWHLLAVEGLCLKPIDSGRGIELDWPGRSSDDLPFDQTKRDPVGVLCLPVPEAGENVEWQSVLVTMPKYDIRLRVPTGIVEGSTWYASISLCGKFANLWVRAGTALPPSIGDHFAEYRPPLDSPPASWRWLALLRHLDLHTAASKDAVGRVRECDLVVADGLQASVDAIHRCRLNTGEPELPDGVSVRHVRERDSGKGERIDKWLKEYLEKNKGDYERLKDRILAHDSDAIANFEKKFGPTALARLFTKEDGAEGDEGQFQSNKTTIIGNDTYKKRIQPLLKGQPPIDDADDSSVDREIDELLGEMDL